MIDKVALKIEDSVLLTAGNWDCLFEMLNCECVAGLCPVLRVAGDKV